jgi:glutathione S-transferase
MHIVRCCQYALVLACAGLLGACAQDKKYEGVSVSRNGDGTSPYTYSAVGSLDFDGQDPGVKAAKVMRAACPQGLPTLMAAQASRITTGSSNQTLLVADGDLRLGESGAIVEYIVQTYGGGRLILKRGEAGFTDYLYWFHFANGTLQPTVGRAMALERVDPSGTSAPMQAVKERLALVFSTIEKRLGEAPYFAAAALTAADIMSVFSLTTMRLFRAMNLSGYPNILAYLQRVGARPAYQRAMQKADPDLTPVLGATVV